MKKCTYCGGQYSDDVNLCPIDSMPVESITPATPVLIRDASKAKTTELESLPKTQCLPKAALLLVIAVAFILILIVVHGTQTFRTKSSTNDRITIKEHSGVDKRSNNGFYQRSNQTTESPRIEGAFGQKLGAVFDPRVADVSVRNIGGIYCRINPSQTNKYFVEYGVHLTPISHKIYAIDAFGPALSVVENQFRMRAVAEALKEKYGLTIEPDDDRVDSQILNAADTNYSISVSFDSKFKFSRLNLNYLYSPLFQKAFLETDELNKKAIKNAAKDKSGL